MNEEKQLEAGPELDRLVGKKLGNDYGEGTDRYYLIQEPRLLRGALGIVPHYSSKIDDAWSVFQFVMTNAYYSRRKRFFQLLQEQNTTSDGSLIAWPDLLSHLRDTFPLAICRAFMAMEGKIHIRNQFT
jgi:hypothetical protein